MTLQEAKDIVAKNWWQGNPSIKHEDFIITVGDIVRETDETDFFPNSYIISVIVVKKNEQATEDDKYEIAVSKETGKCEPAVYIM
jgi:hypothetical protein